MTPAAAIAALALAAAGCGGGSGSGTAAQVSASARQTIVFATQGLGPEGAATAAAVQAFEKVHPTIHVQVLTLSPTSDVALQQLQQRFIAGAATPDVVTTDVIWPATFARPGWLAPLDRFHPDTGAFFPAQAATGEYQGHVYAIPWFINALGLYYRSDMVPSAPASPQQVIADALAAKKAHPSLMEGLAFMDDKYEGAVTALQSFGADLNPASLDNAATLRALSFMRQAHASGASQAATNWQEPNVESAWMSGQAALALNWPYLFAEAEKNPALAKVTHWIPFPSASGQPQASLGGDDLAINAKSTHQAAAWQFISYLTSSQAQAARAVAAGDPPALQAAYTAGLYRQAPWFRDEAPVYKAAVPRPVTPVYPTISTALQTMTSSVLSGQAAPQAALSAAAPAVKQIAQTAGQR